MVLSLLAVGKLTICLVGVHRCPCAELWLRRAFGPAHVPYLHALPASALRPLGYGAGGYFVFFLVEAEASSAEPQWASGSPLESRGWTALQLQALDRAHRMMASWATQSSIAQAPILTVSYTGMHWGSTPHRVDVFS